MHKKGPRAMRSYPEKQIPDKGLDADQVDPRLTICRCVTGVVCFTRSNIEYTMTKVTGQ